MLTPLTSLRTNDTVVGETPDRLATSPMVGARFTPDPLFSMPKTPKILKSAPTRPLGFHALDAENTTVIIVKRFIKGILKGFTLGMGGGL